MANEVEIIITAKDQASDQIKDVSGAMGGLSGMVDEIVTGGLRQLGASVLPMIGGAFDAITGTIGGFINAAMESEVVTARMNAKLNALGDTTKVSAGMITELADEISMMTGFDDEALIEAQTTLLSFGNLSTSMFQDATYAAANLAAMTGMELNTAFQMVGRMLDDPAAGFGRLSRQIGNLTEEEQAAIDAALENNDVLAAQTILLDALASRAQGAGAAYGQTLAGQMDILNVQLGNMAEDIGGAFIPAIIIALEALKPILMDMVDSFAAFVSSDQFKVWLNDITTFVVDKLVPGLQQFADWVVNTGIPALVSATENGKEVTDFFQSVSDAVQKFVEILGKVNGAYWIQQLAQWVRGMFDAVKSGSMPQNWFTLGADMAAGIVKGILSGAASIVNALVGAVMSAYNAAVNFLKEGSPSKLFAEVGKNIMLGMGQGITANASFPINAVTGATAALAPAAMGAGGRGGGFTFVYSPAVSLGTRDEFETKIIPMLDEADRRRRR